VLGECGLLKSLKNAGIKIVEEKPDIVLLGEAMNSVWIRFIQLLI